MRHNIDLAELYDSFAEDIATFIVENEDDIKLVSQIDIHRIPAMGLGRSTFSAIVFEISRNMLKQYKSLAGSDDPEVKSSEAAELRELEAYIETGSVFEAVVQKIKEKLAAEG